MPSWIDNPHKVCNGLSTDYLCIICSGAINFKFVVDEKIFIRFPILSYAVKLCFDSTHLEFPIDTKQTFCISSSKFIGRSRQYHRSIYFRI